MSKLRSNMDMNTQFSSKGLVNERNIAMICFSFMGIMGTLLCCWALVICRKNTNRSNGQRLDYEENVEMEPINLEADHEEVEMIPFHE